MVYNFIFFIYNYKFEEPKGLRNFDYFPLFSCISKVYTWGHNNIAQAKPSLFTNAFGGESHPADKRTGVAPLKQHPAPIQRLICELEGGFAFPPKKICMRLSNSSSWPRRLHPFKREEEEKTKRNANQTVLVWWMKAKQATRFIHDFFFTKESSEPFRVCCRVVYYVCDHLTFFFLWFCSVWGKCWDW